VLEPCEVEDVVEEGELVEGEVPDPQGVGQERGVPGRLELVAEELGVAEDAVQGGPELVRQPDGEPRLVGGELRRDRTRAARPGVERPSRAATRRRSPGRALLPAPLPAATDPRQIRNIDLPA